MIRRAAALLVLSLVPGQAAACPEPTQELLFHSCWGGDVAASILLLPEDRLGDPPGDTLVVTGAYTSREFRGDNLPKPVGLFLRAGEVINRNLGRMDGVLVIDPASGVPALYHRRSVPLGGESYDLTQLDRRNEFIVHAAAGKLSVLQSHLLIVDGVPDVAPRDGAPSSRRRILFTDAYGFGIWQSTASATLYEVVQEIAAQVTPDMALNLDMGGYDYCLRIVDKIRTACGALANIDAVKLSNLIAITRR